MKIDFKQIELYLVTGPVPSSRLSLTALLEQAVLGGVRLIQFRSKNLSDQAFFEEAGKVLEITNRYRVPLIINDRVEIARKLNASGIHLGQEDMRISAARKIIGNKVIGKSTHDLNEARQAVKENVDYINVGPLFLTQSKKTVSPLGVAIVTKISQQIKIPFTTMGGIDLNNVEAVIRAGADRVAVMSALIDAPDPQRVAFEFLQKIHHAKKTRRFHASPK